MNTLHLSYTLMIPFDGEISPTASEDIRAEMDRLLAPLKKQLHKGELISTPPPHLIRSTGKLRNRG